MAREPEGIYARNLLDVILFRRAFNLQTQASPDQIEKRLVNISEPPPTAGTVFAAAVSVAITQTAHGRVVFELHAVRTMPNGEATTNLLARGAAAIVEDETSKKTHVRGEIEPNPRIMGAYGLVIVLLLVWCGGMGVAAAASDYVTIIPLLIAIFTTTLTISVIAWLLAQDLIRVAAMLHRVT